MTRYYGNDNDIRVTTYTYGLFDIELREGEQWLSVYCSQGEEGYADIDALDEHGEWHVRGILGGIDRPAFSGVF